MIPEIDIWRAANLMLNRCGEMAFEESAARDDELAAVGDHNGAAIWRQITDAVMQSRVLFLSSVAACEQNTARAGALTSGSQCTSKQSITANRCFREDNKQLVSRDCGGGP